MKLNIFPYLNVLDFGYLIINIYWKRSACCLIKDILYTCNVKKCIHVSDEATWPSIPGAHCSGSHQSPINIVSANVQADVNLTSFSFTGYDDGTVMTEMTNTGRDGLCPLSCSVFFNVFTSGPVISYNIFPTFLTWCL